MFDIELFHIISFQNVFPKRLARNQKALTLIEHFTSLMLQIRVRAGGNKTIIEFFFTCSFVGENPR